MRRFETVKSFTVFTCTIDDGFFDFFFLLLLRDLHFCRPSKSYSTVIRCFFFFSPFSKYFTLRPIYKCNVVLLSVRQWVLIGIKCSVALHTEIDKIEIYLPAYFARLTFMIHNIINYIYSSPVDALLLNQRFILLITAFISQYRRIQQNFRRESGIIFWG